MITNELNNQRDTSTNQHCPGPVKDTMEEIEKIPGGRNRHKEANNNQQDPALLKALLRKRCFLEDEMVRENFSNHQTIHMKRRDMEITYN